MRRVAYLLAAGSAAVATGCGSSTREPDPPNASTGAKTNTAQRRPGDLTDVQAERLGSKLRDSLDTQAAVFTALTYFSKQKQWNKARRSLSELKALRPARSQFLRFKDSSETAAAYQAAVRTDDAMRHVVLIWRTDPPPYTSAEFAKATALADANTEWSTQLRRSYKELNIPVPAPLLTK